jgi:glyoxylase-like metal-dependent hydrolase (beta-lactamase superfamily II)
MSSRRPESADCSRRDVARLIGAGAIATMFGPPSLAFAQSAAPATRATGDLQGAGFYRTTIGDVRVDLVSDGGFAMDAKALFGDVPADAMEAARIETFMPEGIYPGHLNTLLVREGANVILVDTGGAAMAPTTGRLIANLGNAGVAPADVTHVLVTHAHPDHIGGLLDASGKPAFPNARVLVSEAEHAFWTGSDVKAPQSKLPYEAIKGMAAGATKAFDAVKERLELIRPKQKIGGAITTIDAAGHTPGHLALRIDSGNDALLYVTDAVHIRPLQFARPEYQILFDADREQAMKARKTLLDMAATDRLRISGAHLAFPAIGYVERKGEAYAWVPDVWRW